MDGDGELTAFDASCIPRYYNLKYVAEIEGIIKEIKEDCPNCGKTEVVEKIVEVEKLPEGDYCNIKIHKLWPILFFISLGINLVLAGLIIGFLLKRKKNREDDTPLVDYDIEDDE